MTTVGVRRSSARAVREGMPRHRAGQLPWCWGRVGRGGTAGLPVRRPRAGRLARSRSRRSRAPSRSWPTRRPERPTRRSSRSSRPRRPARASRSSSPTARPATRVASSNRDCRRTSWPWPCGRTSIGSSSRASWPMTGTRTSTTASSTTASSCWPCGRATRRASPAGPTSSVMTSTSSRPTPSPRAAPSGTCWPPTRPRSRTARRPRRRTEYLKQLIANVSVMDKGARDALTTFMAGQGDVLISYENEAIFAQQAGQPIEYVVPDATILIENAVATTLNGDAPEASRAFVDFLYTPEAQRIFGEHGFRPEDETVAARVRLRAARQAVHHRGPRRLGHGPAGVLRPRGRRRGQASSPRSAGMPAEAR